MPNVSFSTLAIGARQFVVHDAFEITVCSHGSYTESLTPMQIVASASPLGAEMTTRLAPPSRCPAALLAVGEEPGRLDHDVDAVVAPGDLGGVHHLELADLLAVDREPGVARLDLLLSIPPTESCFRRNAIVALSPIGSFTATSSTPAPAPRASSARWNERPMRPKPLIPDADHAQPLPDVWSESWDPGLHQITQRPCQSHRIVDGPAPAGQVRSNEVDSNAGVRSGRR